MTPGFPAVISGVDAGSCLVTFGSVFPRAAGGFPESAFCRDSSDGGGTNSWMGVVSLLFDGPEAGTSAPET